MNKENEKKLSQWDEATILAESLKVPEISWLSPDYSLPSKCADFNGEPRIDDIKLFKLDMVTFEKWGNTNRLLISGNFNTPNFFSGTSDTPPSSWQPGDVYLKYE